MQIFAAMGSPSCLNQTLQNWWCHLRKISKYHQIWIDLGDMTLIWPTNSVMWENHTINQPFGNGKHTTYKKIWWLGDGANGIVLPTLFQKHRSPKEFHPLRVSGAWWTMPSQSAFGDLAQKFGWEITLDKCFVTHSNLYNHIYIYKWLIIWLFLYLYNRLIWSYMSYHCYNMNIRYML